MSSLSQEVDLDGERKPLMGFGEETSLELDGVSLGLGSVPEIKSEGKVVVTTRRLIWLPLDVSQQPQSWMFPNIILHAIQSDPEPCLYCQLDATTLREEDQGPNAELRVFVADPNRLFQLYSVMCDCAALNPDPNEEEDDEDSDAFFDKFAIDPSLPLSSLSLASGSLMNDDDDGDEPGGQFEDYEEEEEGFEETHDDESQH